MSRVRLHRTAPIVRIGSRNAPRPPHGHNPLPPTYCYLKLRFLPVELGYFQAVNEGKLQSEIGKGSGRVIRRRRGRLDPPTG